MNASELESKILQMLDGELPAAEVAALEVQLLASVESRETYRKLARLHSSLETRHESRAVVANTNIVPIDRIMARQRKRILHLALGAAAAIVLVSVVVLSLMKVPDPPVASFRTLPGSVFTLAHEGEGEDVPEGKVLAVGSRLRLESGSVEATFESGVRVVAEGACDLRVLDEDRVALDQGIAWFEVPGEAVGFTVETKEFVVVDLGTAFGVVASAAEPDEIHVTQGSVEVTLRDGGENAVLAAGEARRGDRSGKLVSIKPEASKFVTQLRKSRSVRVKNPSFEADSGTAEGAPTGWAKTGEAGAGHQRFRPHQVPQATDGAMHGWTNGSSALSQIIASEVIADGATYTLTVDVGQVSNFSGSRGAIRLISSGTDAGKALRNANGTAELTRLAPPSGGPYQTVSVSYRALASGDPFAGQAVGIELVGSSGDQVLWDHVRLDVVAPE